jgi:hypothetical protein
MDVAEDLTPLSLVLRRPMSVEKRWSLLRRGE